MAAKPPVGKPDAYWLKANTKPEREKQGALCVAIHLPTRNHHLLHLSKMKQSNPLSDFVQFIIGGCFFAAGVFLLSNQVMVRAPMAIGGAIRSGYGRGWGAGFAFPWGSPGMGLLLLPLGIGLCMAFADVYARWSKLLIWGSLSALLMGVLNSIRMSFVPTTLWMLGVYVGMIGIGGGLMFKGLKGVGDDQPQSPQSPQPSSAENADVLEELAELRAKVDRMNQA